MKSKIFLLMLIATASMQTANAQNIKNIQSSDEINVGKVSDIPTLLSEQLNLPKGNTFVDQGVYKNDSLISTTSACNDELGYTHLRYNQYYNGIRIEGSSLIVHMKGENIVYTNGDYYQCHDIDTRPNINPEKAILAAQKYVSSIMNGIVADSAIVTEGEPEIIICHSKQNPKDTTLYLCYRMHVSPLNGYIYINAYSGEPMGYVMTTIFANGIAYTRYSGIQSITTKEDTKFLCFGKQFYLIDNIRHIYTSNLKNQFYPYVGEPGTEKFVDNDNTWTTGEHQVNKNNGALDVHWGLEQTYDYFLNNHNWRSFDGNGCDIKAYVHAYMLCRDASGNIYQTKDNAGYFPEYNHLEFGDGGGDRDMHTSLDIVAHEFAHAIFHHLVNTDEITNEETFAINEGLSDIWGACVEKNVAPSKQTWLIGEDIYYNGGSIRNMSNPKSKEHPNTYKGDFWYEHPERHAWAGVLDYWFYLLANGGSGTNDFGYHYNVTGIGMEKAARIVFRAERYYINNQTNYKTLCEYMIRAAKDLSSGQEVASTIEAWRAVGLLPDYYTKDNVYDNGSEPLQHISEGYDSPDIWVRRHEDNGTTHQRAKHNSTNYVYVNIRNRGITQTSDFTNQIIPTFPRRKDSVEVYIKKAGLSVDNWPNDWTKIGSVALPSVASGNVQTVCIKGHFPSVENIHPNMTSLGKDVDYAILTRIVSNKDPMSFIEGGNTIYNVINNNNISYKNAVVSSAIFYDEIYQQRAILDINNIGKPLYKTNLQLTSPRNCDGSQLFREAEIRLVFEKELLNLWSNTGAKMVGLKQIDDTMFIVSSPNAEIQGATIPEDYYGYICTYINFLTHEYTEKYSYEYTISQYDTKDNEIISSASVIVYKNPRDVLFDAKAGDDLIASKNSNVVLSAESINEDAVYNWYNAGGKLIGSGDTLSVNVSKTEKYKLEVIAKADGYKDYDSVYVFSTYGNIESIAPNPANMQTLINYNLSEEIANASIIITNSFGQVFYSTPLDITQDTHTINLQGIPAGQYIVRLESQGVLLDTKTLIVY